MDIIAERVLPTDEQHAKSRIHCNLVETTAKTTTLIQSLAITSSILVAEVGEPPDVAQTDACSTDRQQEVEPRRPRVTSLQFNVTCNMIKVRCRNMRWRSATFLVMVCEEQKLEAESTYVFVWVIQTLNSDRAMSISRHVSGGVGSIIPTRIQSRFLFPHHLKEIAIRCVY